MKKFFALFAIPVSLLFIGASTSVYAAAKSEAPITSKDKNGNEYEVKGYVAMKAAPNAKQFKASKKIASAKLPKKVDLRGMMTKIEDQGESNSCSANAIAGSYEYWVWRTTEQDYNVSRLFLYYNARLRVGDEDKDDGAVLQAGMEGLRDFGACSEERWPFEKPLLVKKPNRGAYEEASQFKIKEMAQVPTDLKAWKQALASGYPIVFGCLLFESFDQANERGGVVPMPSPEDVGRESHGGHAMCAVGYSDKEQVFIVRNSWGDKWGDKGYCYMPYNYLMNPEFNIGDSWVFVPEAELKNPEDTWIEDDKPVTDGGRGVKFVINPYSVEDYKDVKITWWEEFTVDYKETADKTYIEYAALAKAEEWESMEDFDCEEVITEWQEENPDEESSMYVAYETEEGDVEEDESAMEETEESGDEDSADEEMEEDAEDEEVDGEMEIDEDDVDAEEEDMEEAGDEEYEDDSEAEEGDEEMEEDSGEEYEDEAEVDEEMEEEAEYEEEDDGGGEEEGSYEDEGGEEEE